MVVLVIIFVGGFADVKQIPIIKNYGLGKNANFLNIRLQKKEKYIFAVWIEIKNIRLLL